MNSNLEEAELEGSVIKIKLIGRFLHLSFQYSKTYFEAIKKIKSARYSKQARAWILPIEQFQLIKESAILGSAELKLDFSAKEFEQALVEQNGVLFESQSRLRNNPFDVQQKDIDICQPDCHFIISGKIPTLILKPKQRSLIKQTLQELKYLFYLEDDKTYAVPLWHLNDLLKALKDLHFTFAFEHHCAEQLKIGASFRKDFKNRQQANTDHLIHFANQSDLESALLYPLVSKTNDQPNKYYLYIQFREQLKTLLPERRLNNKNDGYVLTELELTEVILAARKNNLELFFSSEVQSDLQKLTERCKKLANTNSQAVPGNLLGLYQPEICWLLWNEKAAYLGFTSAAFESLEDNILRFLNSTGRLVHCAGFPKNRFFAFDEDNLCATFAELQKLLPSSCTAEFNEYLTRLNERSSLSNKMQKLNQLRDLELGLVNSNIEKSLFPHQRVAVGWILETEAGLLGDDMGLGKTLSILAAFEELYYRQVCDFLLVIAPQSLLRNWQREAESWFKELRVLRLAKGKQKRQRDLEKLSDYRLKQRCLVLNFELLRVPDVFEGVLELCRKRQVFLVIDESQRAKNPRSQTFQALKQLVEYCPRRFLLSGTPIPRDITDIWSQMYIIDQGLRFGQSFYEWLQSIAELGTNWSEYAVKKFKPEQVEKCIARVREVLLRRKKDKVLSLPKKIFMYRDLELTGSQKKRYDEVREELLVRISKTDTEAFIKEIDSILEEYLRAVQIASNPRLVDAEWEGTPVKFKELDDLLAEIVGELGEKAIIWTNYRDNVEELVKRYEAYGARPFSGSVHPDERARTVEIFQDVNSEVKVLVAIPAAGGVGITLTAAQTAIYLDKTWNAEHWMQSIDRIHRIGQKHSVRIISLHACGVDYYIAKNLKRKVDMQAKLLGDNEGQVMSKSEVEHPSREELIAALQD